MYDEEEEAYYGEDFGEEDRDGTFYLISKIMRVVFVWPCADDNEFIF